MLRECFPSRLDVYHVWSGKSGSWVVDLIMPVVKQLAGRHIRLRMVCHRGYETLPNFCTTYNFNARDMSVIMGGNFAYGDHLLWVHEERVREQQQQQEHQHQWKQFDSVMVYGEAIAQRTQGDLLLAGNKPIVAQNAPNCLIPAEDWSKGPTPRRRLSMSSAPRAAWSHGYINIPPDGIT